MGRNSKPGASGGRRGWPFLLLLLAALLVRGVTPAGWMPSPQAKAGAAFVICTAQGAHPVAPDHGGRPSGPATHQHHDVCAFAGHHAAPGSAGPLHLGSRLAASARLASPLPSAGRVEWPRHRDQEPRGPPLFV